MALSNTEKVRRHRERKKVELKALSKPNLLDLRTPFHEYLDDNANWSDVTLALELAGIVAPVFQDDRGPEAYADPDAIAGVDDPFAGYDKSIGRAEVVVGCLLDAATGLARVINNYKKKELGNRISELEQADLSDRAERKAAMADVVRFSKMMDQLEKQVRWTLPQWKVVGEQP